jgi:hypothetical protein
MKKVRMVVFFHGKSKAKIIAGQVAALLLLLGQSPGKKLMLFALMRPYHGNL